MPRIRYRDYHKPAPPPTRLVRRSFEIQVSDLQFGPSLAWQDLCRLLKRPPEKAPTVAQFDAYYVRRCLLEAASEIGAENVSLSFVRGPGEVVIHMTLDVRPRLGSKLRALLRHP